MSTNGEEKIELKKRRRKAVEKKEVKNKYRNKIQKKRKLKKILIIFFIMILLIIASVFIFINIKLSKFNHQAINKNDLEVNHEIFEQVSDNVTKSEFKDIKTIVFFGVDNTDTKSGFSSRSDTIIIVSINPKTKKINLISIPRDTYVNIPGRNKDKINHAYAYGKEQLSIKTINSNFGLNITEYVTIDFEGLIHVINKVGGVTINITEAERQYINEYVSESYALSKNKIKKVKTAGLVTLTGEQALTHSRNRTIGNDFERANRQRTVIEALISKISSLGINEILKLSDSILPEVKTNVNITNYVGLLTSVISEKNKYLENIISSQVPAANYSAGKMIDGVYYFTTDLTKAKQDFLDKLYGK